MVKHKLLIIGTVVLAIIMLSTQTTAQIPAGIYSGSGPLTDLFSVPAGSGLTFGIGSWGGYSMFGPFGMYDEYGLFGAYGLFGPSGPGYGSGLGFNGFGMHDPMALVKLSKQGVKV